MGEKRTEISAIGEFGLIDLIKQQVSLSHKTTLKGIGDDAAVISPTSGEKMVVTTDFLVEGIHFNLMYAPLKHLGYKAVAVNLSDVLAMNAIPSHITVSIALSNRFSVEAVKELYAGIQLACTKYNIDLVGGDTTASTSGLNISITAFGSAKQKAITYRKGAKLNDLICVSGDLGAAYMGLQILEREKAAFSEQSTQPDLGKYAYLLERQLKPEPRKDIIEYFKTEGITPTSMIDISDGLASELLHICKESTVGVQIYEDKIPIDQETHSTALEMNLSPSMCALNGGEDYELLFTLSLEEYEKIKDYKGISIIGHITDVGAGAQMVTPGDTVVPITAQGWDGLKAAE